MANRVPGPSNVVATNNVELRQNVAVIAPCSYAGPTNSDSWTDEEKELVLDITQMALDIAGIFEPTPFADLSSGGISVWRGDWIGAATSGLGLIPYLGDLAKAGRLGRYAQTLQSAIALAARSPRFAAWLRPMLQRLSDLFNSVPIDNLANSMKETINSLKRPLDAFLGNAPPRVMASSPWWVVEDVGPLIRGTSIPRTIRMRVGSRRWEIARNESALLPNGTPMGPATIHLAERAQHASEWSKLSAVDYPMSAVAGALEQFEKKMLSGQIGSGGSTAINGTEIRNAVVDDWILSVDMRSDTWRVFHLEYNPSRARGLAL